MSVTADGIHLMETAGEVIVTNSLFENCGDDALNVHGFYSTLKEISNERRTIHIVNERDYNFSPSKGDTLGNRQSGNADGKMWSSRSKKWCRGTSGRRFVRRHLFRGSARGEAAVGDMVVNKIPCGESKRFPTTSCGIKRCRGILIQTAAGGTVEHNLFAQPHGRGGFCSHPIRPNGMKRCPRPT